MLLIASEAHPFAKSGGLADVLGALPPALARLGWQATVVLPRYRGVDAGILVERFPVTVGSFTRDVGFFDAEMTDGARAILVDCPDLYDRESLYGPNNTEYPDNALRFAMLARAALEWAGRRGRRPDVIHAHDWQAGLAPVYLKTVYASHPILAGTPSVMTIHNLAYQGNFAADWLPRLDIGWEHFTVDGLEFWNGVSFLKGGINYADWVTTVSPRYAEEIQTPEAGFGFDGIIRARRDRLTGILNGIDTWAWDPSRDRFLPKPFSAGDLTGKAASKVEVLKRYGLPTDEASLARPVIGMVSRMVDQKGLDLIAALALELPRLNATFVILGTGDPVYEQFWRALALAHPDRIGARVGFDESLAHLIEAGADMFMMPSRYEPCGLNQMYSLRYGTVPIVRAVGGLADTVREADADGSAPSPNPGGKRRGSRQSRSGPATKRPASNQAGEGGLVAPKPVSNHAGGGGTGFVFQDYTPQALLGAIERAIGRFADPGRWRALQANGMAEDHSWDRSAAEYVKMYDRLS